MEDREDWPFGPALRMHRERLGLSVKAAARATGKKVSDGRWYQLESGYQKIRDQLIPIGTTAATVAAAAAAVGWDVDEALALAGFSKRAATTSEGTLTMTVDVPLTSASDEDLIAEVRRRMKGARHGVADQTQSPASDEASEDEEADRSADDPKLSVGLDEVSRLIIASSGDVDQGNDGGQKSG